MKCLGDKDYWSYEDFSTPNGTGGIELSRGNYYYGQVEAVIPNNNMPVEIGRAYNSQASTASSLGMGWNHSYDLELLNINENDELKDRKAIKDATGTIFLFEKNPDGTYASSMGKYITLKEEKKTEPIQIPARNGNTAVNTEVESTYTMLTKDNVEYRFNVGGQLVYEKEPNGSFVLLTYDSRHGRLLAITTNQNLVTRFSYADHASDVADMVVQQASEADAIQETAAEEEALSMEQIAGSMAAVPGGKTRRSATVEEIVTNLALVRSITLPDGGVIRYHYNDLNLLTMVERMDSADGNQKITYRYAYDDNDNLSEIQDALGNVYRLEYTDDRVTTVFYPAVNGDQESIRFVYSSIQEGDMVYQTSVRRGLNGTYGVEDLYKSSRNGNTLYTRDTQGVECTYTYEDNMLKSTSMKSEYQEIEADTVVTKEGVRVSETSYDADQNMNPVLDTDEDGNTTSYEYGDQSDELVDDLPVRIVDSSDGVVISDFSYEYDEYGNETMESDSVTGDSTQTVYYGQDSEFAGEIQEIIEKNEVISEDGEEKYYINSKRFEYARDAATGIRTIRLIEKKDGKTVVSVQKIDNMGNFIYSDDGLGTITLHEYDYLGRVVKSTYIEGGITSTEEMAYDDNGILLRKKDKNGTISVFSYDVRNRKIKEVVKKGSIERTYITSYGYEWYDNLQDQQEILYVVTQKNPGERAEKSYVNDAGWELKTVSNGIATINTYNRHGEMILSITQTEDGQEMDQISLNVYDNSGNQTAEIQNPVNQNGIWKIDENSIVNLYTYDLRGNMLSMTDSMGITTNYEYDELSRVKKVILPDSPEIQNVTQYFYDIYEDENVSSTKTVDANGNVSKTYVDENGETVRIADIGDGKVTPISTEHQYDLKGNMIQATFSDGSYKKYEYDGKNRLISVIYYQKDGTGKLHIKYTYSSSDQILSEEDLVISEGVETRYCYYQYTYNDADELTEMKEYRGDNQESVNEQRYTYDAAGRKASVTYVNAPNNVQALKYEYNENGWLTSVKVREENGEEVILRTYRYSSFGKVVEIKDYRSFERDANHAYVSRQYEYDSFGRVHRICYRDSDALDVTKEQYEYVYDKNSRILMESIQKNYVAENIETIDERRMYTYDALGRLTASEKWDCTDDTRVRATYTYDKVGNRISRTENGVTTDYTYNSLNQLINEKTTEASVLKNDKVIEYDLNGNLQNETDKIGNTRSEYSYDVENRLTTFVQKKNNILVLKQNNTYNGNGQRIEKVENGHVTDYMYQDGTVLFTEDEVGNRTGFNLLGLDSNIIASWRADDEFYFYNRDVKGSSTSILNQDGEAVVSYQYGDFGETQKQGDPSFLNEICYTGGIYDENTGLYYLNARYYNPENGRFLSQDTYRGETTEASSWHLYAYCANNPISQLDPSGHYIETVFDVISMGWSAYDFITRPSWVTAGSLLWDTAAFFMPFIQGSYSIKGIKIAKTQRKLEKLGDGRKAQKLIGNLKSRSIKELTLRIASKSGDFRMGSKCLIVGKYRQLKKFIRNKPGIEVHHIIEGRFGMLNLPLGDYPAIPISKALHARITKEWYNFLEYRRKGSESVTISKHMMIIGCKKVYRAMPQLKELAVALAEKYGKESVVYEYNPKRRR